MKLYCLPCAGGSKQAYADWKKYFKENPAQQIEIEGLEIKGRGERLGAGFYRDFAEAVEDIYSLIAEKPDGEDYALFGHSMGSVLAYELYYRIAAAGKREPRHIFFTGRYGPHVQGNMYVTASMPDEELIGRLLELGGIPKQLPESRELLEFYLPIIRNDLRVLDTYVFREREARIKCGVTVINGKNDSTDSRRDITWRDLCGGDYRAYTLNGGHFFINHCQKELFRIIAERLGPSGMKNLIPEKPVFLFPGVGGEYSGFLEQLEERQAELLQEYRRVLRRETGLDLSGDSRGGGDRMFEDWLALFTGDCLVYQTYLAWGIRPAVLLGYSMGLITAMVCGRAISYADGLLLLQTIYEYSQPYAAKRGMGVIIGKSRREAAQIIAEAKLENEVYLAAENSDTCIVISGRTAGLDRVLHLAAQRGALKAAFIKAPNAFHSPLAAEGIASLVQLVGKTEIGDSDVPLMSVYNQKIIQGAPDLKRELVLNMTGAMKWKESILTLGSMGMDSFVEVSPADELTRMSRVINLEYKFYTYKKIRKLRGA